MYIKVLVGERRALESVCNGGVCFRNRDKAEVTVVSGDAG